MRLYWFKYRTAERNSVFVFLHGVCGYCGSGDEDNSASHPEPPIACATTFSAVTFAVVTALACVATLGALLGVSCLGLASTARLGLFLAAARVLAALCAESAFAVLAASFRFAVRWAAHCFLAAA